MSTEKPKYKYVQDEPDDQGRLIAKGSLKKGLKIDGKVHRDFTMREAFAEDMFDAEANKDVKGPLQFDAAIWTRTLLCLGTWDGPITLGMLGKLRQLDYATLRDAQLELDKAGESE